ncbi:MAG: hypothetical protein WC822_02910 [Candidatus Paceibacterota bacterium]|jgi:hypothetical protein
MKNIFKGLGLGLIALLLVVGVRAGSAGAVLTIGATNLVTDGAFTVTSVGASEVNMFAANTTGAINIGGTSQTSGDTTIYGGTSAGAITLTPGGAGTIVIGKTDGTGAITLGSSTGAQTVNIGTGTPGANANVVNIATGVVSTGSQYVHIADGAASGAGTTTVDIANGANAGVTTVNIANTALGAVAKVVSIAGGNDGAASTVNIGLGNKTGTNTIAIGTGTGAQAISIGNGGTGAANITIGSITAGSSTTALRGYNVAIAQKVTTGTLTVGSTAATGNVTYNGVVETGVNSLFDNTTTANTTIGAALTSGTLTIGKSTQTGAVVIYGSVDGANTLFNNVTTGSISIGTVATGAINIGAGAAVHAITIGSTTTTGTLSLLAGSTDGGGITISGALLGASPLVLEGATANDYETTLALTDPTADRTVTIPNVTGQVQVASACTALTPGTAVTLTINTSNCYTDTITTDNEDQTITFSAGGTAGTMITVIFITDTGGSGDEVITFHTTLANTVGTLTLANGTATRYTITFMSDGTVWNEIARTAVQS